FSANKLLAAFSANKLLAAFSANKLLAAFSANSLQHSLQIPCSILCKLPAGFSQNQSPSKNIPLQILSLSTPYPNTHQHFYLAIELNTLARLWEGAIHFENRLHNFFYNKSLERDFLCNMASETKSFASSALASVPDL